MTKDQQIVCDWCLKLDGLAGTFEPSKRAELQEKVDAANRVIGCSLVVRALNDDEIDDEFKHLPESERHLVVAEA